jgi:DNA polymerase III subunit epsilon
VSRAPGRHGPRDARPGPPASLAERAREALAAGPLPTAALAELVLGLRGNPPAAAAAVFTLLGGDPDFRVDAAGVWSCVDHDPAPPVPRLLSEERWVVVDVETTGGSPAHGHRVTEVAAVWVEGGEIREAFSSLVNPERRIPGMITSLTGISNEMVAGAPRFRELTRELRRALRGRVFVAHNAPFDWRFLSAELELATGAPMGGRQLCTVRLGRRLLPELPSRSLDSLARYFGLEIASRHRALDDAMATAKVLLRFLDRLADRGVEDWAGVEAVLGQRTARRKRRAMPRSMDSA